jgi:hypothetical protein
MKKTTKQTAADNVFKKLKDDPKAILKWANDEIKEYRKLIEIMRKAMNEENDHESFDFFLQAKHAEQYQGLDDDMPDDYNEWLGKIDPEQWIIYGDDFVEYKINNF